MIVGWSLKEDVVVVDGTGYIIPGNARAVGCGGIVVASSRLIIQVWIAAVMADGFGSLASLEMTLSSSESSIAPALSASLAIAALGVALHPGECAPLIVDGERTVCVILPSFVVSAETGSDLGLRTNGDVDAIDSGGRSLMESNTDLDLVVLPLLTETAQRLLTTHLDTQLRTLDILTMFDWGNMLPWVSLFIVPLVLGVTDDLSLGDIAEVVFSLAVEATGRFA